LAILTIVAINIARPVFGIRVAPGLCDVGKEIIFGASASRYRRRRVLADATGTFRI
jgi:hypothetical protein